MSMTDHMVHLAWLSLHIKDLFKRDDRGERVLRPEGGGGDWQGVGRHVEVFDVEPNENRDHRTRDGVGR